MNIPDEIYRQMGMTSPDELHLMLDCIEEEEPGPSVSDYSSVIVRLHDQKNMSFRAITAFLAKHGVKTNRTTVYDLYKEAKMETEEPEGPLVDEDTGEVVEN